MLLLKKTKRKYLMKKITSPVYSKKVNNIINNAEKYHDNFYSNSPFTGPSLYFHRKTINSHSDCLDNNELIYATLVSWGMHRMGPKGAKMVEYDIFTNSLDSLKDKIVKLSKIKLEDMLTPNSEGWELARTIFHDINIMESKVYLVGNSKVMTHLFPHLFAPIDRRYTLNFLFNKQYISGDIEYQWKLFKKIHIDFYYPILMNNEIQNLIEKWLKENDKEFKWDTYPLKIIDNLIIGSQK